MRPKTQASDYVFVIRLWREPSVSAADDEAWRGQLSHKDGRRHFVGLQKLFVLITQSLTVSHPETETTPSESDRR